MAKSINQRLNVSGKEEIDVGKLQEVHKLYAKYYSMWTYLNAAYEGIRALINWGVLEKHERESEANFERRKKEAYGFGYSRSICDLFNSYLFKKDFPKSFPDGLANDDQWQMFMEDCDLEETPFDDFFVNQQLMAGIMGHVGIFVDRPEEEKDTRQQELEDGIYPYLTAFKPTAIMDWDYERDNTGRKRLTYLKLYDDDDRYLVWTLEEYAVFKIVESEAKGIQYTPDVSPDPRAGKAHQKGIAIEEEARGDNPLGEIPFTVLYNQRSTIDKEVGTSDISEVSRIDGSIIRNLSQIEEIINYAAFPMMRKPKEEQTKGEEQNEVGPTAILEFDPETPEAKPDWLNSEVGGPVEAVLKVIAKKVEEIYRASNAGGMSATEISKSAKSGVALKTEFQLLNGKLVRKGKNVVSAQKKSIEYWLKWQDEYEKYYDDVTLENVKTFEVEDLATDLENLLTSSVIVTDSPEYKKEIQKMVARLILPSSEDELIAKVIEEIESQEFAGEGDFFTMGGGPGEETVPPAPANNQEQ